MLYPIISVGGFTYFIICCLLKASIFYSMNALLFIALAILAKVLFFPSPVKSQGRFRKVPGSFQDFGNEWSYIYEDTATGVQYRHNTHYDWITGTESVTDHVLLKPDGKPYTTGHSSYLSDGGYDD